MTTPNRCGRSSEETSRSRSTAWAPTSDQPSPQTKNQTRKVMGNEQTGTPGDVVSISARGFSSGEKINVFWGRVSGEPAATLQADEGGSVGEAAVQGGVGARG